MAIAFLDLAASMPTKTSVYSTMARPPCAEDRLGPPEQPSSRIVDRTTSSTAGRTYGHTAGKPSARSACQSQTEVAPVSSPILTALGALVRMMRARLERSDGDGPSKTTVPLPLSTHMLVSLS